MEHNRTRAASLFAMDHMDFRQRGAPLSGTNHLDLGRYRPHFFALDQLDCARVRPAPAPAMEHSSRITDFSIERILSSDLGPKMAVEQIPGPSYVAPGTVSFPHLQCIFYPSYQVIPRVTDTQAYHYNVTGQRSQDESRAQQQWRPRVRTVFTDSQRQQLEELFERTRYPDLETRAEVARNIGLSEDTVRIWFKNQRARRKRKTRVT